MAEVFCFPGKGEGAELRAAFLERYPEVEGSTNKAEALEALEPHHREAVAGLGFEWSDLWRAEQVHGCEVAVVPREGEQVSGQMVNGVDGLITQEPGVLLGIYVADCAAVSLVDPVTGALGLVHAGRKGAEGGIVLRAIGEMVRCFGTKAADLEAWISPCIRPPHFEIDFVSLIHEQLHEAGVQAEKIADEGISTAENLDLYYSYRVEQGKTGRMLALLGWADKDET